MQAQSVLIRCGYVLCYYYVFRTFAMLLPCFWTCTIILLCFRTCTMVLLCVTEHLDIIMFLDIHHANMMFLGNVQCHNIIMFLGHVSWYYHIFGHAP